MTESQHHFEEAYISGYLDGELTQADTQRVRIHLEDCATCRSNAEAMSAIKEATMGSRFQVPRDMQWDESPRGHTSRRMRDAGLVIGLAWLIGSIGWLIAELAGSGDVLGVLLVGGFVLAAGLILGSVYLDRRETGRSDRYRKVEK
jgi:anti-sigma factor RsiW